MFKVDDYIVYGGNGVCKVLSIGVPTINGANNKREYYRLQPIYENNSIIYIPVDNDKVVMRNLMSKEEANALIKSIPSIELLHFDNEKMPQEKYKEVLFTYNSKDLIKVIKTSYLRKEKNLAEGKKNISTDDKYLKMAEEYLYGELAISLDIPKEQVRDFIAHTIENMYSQEEFEEQAKSFYN